MSDGIDGHAPLCISLRLRGDAERLRSGLWAAVGDREKLARLSVTGKLALPAVGGTTWEVRTVFAANWSVHQTG